MRYQIVGIISLLFIGFINLNSTFSVEKIPFQIIQLEKGMAIKSCISVDQYVHNLRLPEGGSQVFDKSKAKSSSQTLVIQGGFWEEDCLIIPIVDDSDETILIYIQQVTNYSAEEIEIIK